MCDSINQAWCIRENVQNSRQAIDTLPLSWYSLTHINHFTVTNSRPATAPNHFAAIHLRQNPLVPCGAVFFISRENLQPDHRPAILHTRTLKTASAVWIWIPATTPHKMRASRTTPLQHRGRNADPVQAATPAIEDTSICVPLARFRGNPFLPAYAGQKFLPPNIPLGTKFSPRTAHSLRSYTLRV